MSDENLVEQATVSHLELLDIPSISRIPSKTPVFNISNCNVLLHYSLRYLQFRVSFKVMIPVVRFLHNVFYLSTDSLQLCLQLVLLL